MIVEPPFYRLYKSTYSLTKFSLALGYLAGAVMEQTDWQVQTYNADFHPQSASMKVTYLAGKGFYNYLEALNGLEHPIWGEVRRAIEDFRPSVLGLTSKTQNFTSSCNVARIAKLVDPRIVVILGGPHASMAPTDALANCDAIDIAVRGEGEETLVELLRRLETGQSIAGTAGTIIRKTDDTRLGGTPRKAIGLEVLHHADSNT